MINASDEPWVVWCDLNSESSALAKAIPGAVEVRGSDSIEQKEERLRAFSAGEKRVIVTKPSIAGHGLNWQHCRNVAFVGISHSYEQFYQAVRRVWRYGQHEQVHVHIFGAGPDSAIIETIKRRSAPRCRYTALRDATRPRRRRTQPDQRCRSERPRDGRGRGLAAGARRLRRDHRIAGAGEHRPVRVQPPFPGMYVYTDDPRDMGTSRPSRR